MVLGGIRVGLVLSILRHTGKGKGAGSERVKGTEKTTRNEAVVTWRILVGDVR
ncbi:hypothetical protein SLEP1_g5848 [Rubroshorea leprosula]|uniref:Uncharacterized protein n=1 Tax=Rubroshorea leprosula TaxID=152421 RepID=A0AAV5HZ34_9ROSI|nr:hypothetical protein SLEP1_g5848 [Rubroshorea leprosula]